MKLKPSYLNFKLNFKLNFILNLKRQSPLYAKMFCTYTAIIVAIAAALTLYFISDSRKRLLEAGREEIERIGGEAVNYIEETGRTAEYIHKDLYQSSSELDDLLAYFQLGTQAYEEYALRRYIASIDLVYRGIFHFLNETFEAYRNLEKIELISYQTLQMTECYPEKNVYPGKDGKARLKQVQNDRYCKKGKLVYAKEVRHPDTLKPVGCILFTFEASQAFEEICGRSKYAQMVVTYADDEVIFPVARAADAQQAELQAADARKEELQAEDAQKEELQRAGIQKGDDWGADAQAADAQKEHSLQAGDTNVGDANAGYQIQAKKKQYAVCNENVMGHQVYTYIDERQASRLPPARLLLFLAVGAAVSAAGIVCIHYYIKRLTNRVDTILSAMNRVTTGDFHVRLATGKTKDELDMIAGNFNAMCEKLKLYIEKSYLEEIERKNAQMQALQSQINPHFLYNTLEAIRMKAICNGDREVGKMLYSMVVLFRSQLKEADVITLGQELDYCKQYMELFEYRYQGSFRSRVDCEPELLALPVIKFVLQPVIENYFVHGIERDRQDNEVRVWAQQKDETLFLYVQDNGCGMEPELLEQKNRQLQENRMQQDAQQKASIGIQNVNRRIKAVYGDRYGVFLEAAAPKGLLVTITLKAGQ